ncbi:hypothetical protein [Arthrobacter sp. H14]|uniref:hypothetical protein n=1 Tax=Arthrobacter sp. H14 TaxID=1312959 RepID=UPI00047A38DB|nr:hypothetical protein [Arthrobacter sp. H14]
MTVSPIPDSSPTDEWLSELEALHTSTTKGHWTIYPAIHEQNRIVQKDRGLFGLIADVSTEPKDYGRADAQRIVESHEAFPHLLAELSRLRAQNAELKDAARA